MPSGRFGRCRATWRNAPSNHVEPQHHAETQHQRHLVRRRLPVRSRSGLGRPKEEPDRVLKRCRFRHGAEALVMSSAASCRLCWRSPDFTVSVRERPAPVHHDGRRGRQGTVKGSPSQARARSYTRSPHFQDGLDRSAPALKPAIRSPMRNRCRKFQPCRGWRSRLARKSHKRRCIGALTDAKLLCSNDLAQSEELPDADTV
jgi:hypothetical protein